MKRTFELRAQRSFSESHLRRVLDALSIMIDVHSTTPPRPNGRPYAIHPLRVALTVLETFAISDAEVVIAALLHDTVEDEPAAVATLTDGAEPEESRLTESALAALETRYGSRVSGLVRRLTNPDFGADGNPVVRNARYRDHLVELFRGEPDACIIKMADFMDNALGLEHLTEKGRLKRLRSKYCPVVEFLIGFLPGLSSTHPLSDSSGWLSRQFESARATQCGGSTSSSGSQPV